MTPYINPLGFIDQRTRRGVRFLLTNPADSLTLKVGIPVTISQPSNDGLALAKIRGELVAVGYVTATFTIAETLLDERWPQNEETIREKTPVYLAKENSFEPDPSRMLTAEQVERLRTFRANTPTSSETHRATTRALRAHPTITHRRKLRPSIPFPQQLDE